MEKINCCEKLTINGILTHEIGCEWKWRDDKLECRWCGQEFKPENRWQITCSHNCYVCYSNLVCYCNECNNDRREE